MLRLLRGEDLELLSRKLGVTAAELSGWREAFLAAGEAALKTRPADARDAEIGRPGRLRGHGARNVQSMPVSLDRAVNGYLAKNHAAPAAA